MAVTDENWEGGTLGTWTIQGSPAVDSTAAIHGSFGLHIATTAAVEYVAKSFTQPCKMWVGQCYFKIVSNPTTAKEGIVVATGNSGMRIYVRTDGKISAQALAGTERISAASYSDGQVHRLGWKFDRTDAATAKIDWQVDGAAQTQATAASASLDMTDFRWGIDGTDTAEIYLDTLTNSFVGTDYPLAAGQPVSVTPTTLALTDTLFAPTVQLGIKPVPTTLSLTTSLFAPTVTAGGGGGGAAMRDPMGMMGFFGA